jgi:hypothetical protein
MLIITINQEKKQLILIEHEAYLYCELLARNIMESMYKTIYLQNIYG